MAGGAPTVTAKYRDRLFSIANRFRDGEIDDAACMDRIDDLLDEIAARAARTVAPVDPSIRYLNRWVPSFIP